MRNTHLFLATTLTALSLALSHPAAASSYYYEAVTRDGGASARVESTVRGWIDGSNAKVEYQGADMTGMFMAGSYLLTTDGGATLYLVNPSEQTISELDLDAMFGMVGNVMSAVGGLVNMRFGDFENERLAQRADETMLGYPTTYYHFKTGYTMSMSVLGMRNETRTETEQHVWCADGLQADGFGIWLRPDRFRTGNEELDQLIAQEYGAIDCVPLRTRTTTTVAEQRGRPTTTESEMEVTVLRAEAIPASTFELPADYEHVPLMAGLPDELREMMEQSGAFESEEPASDEGGRRPRLRDLLR
jgi:hypothetical protein